MSSDRTGKARAASTSSQDSATPRKRSRFDLTPEAPMPSTSYAIPHVSSKRDGFTDEKHKELDAQILNKFSASKEIQRMPDLPSLLFNIATGDERLVRLSKVKAEELLKDHPSIEGMLKNAWEAGTFKQVRQLLVEILWPDRPRHQQSTYDSDESGFIRESKLATMQSWNIEYVSNAADSLYQHLCFSISPSVDVRYTSIVQSSGTGKSRAIDELSKRHLVVPLCLREHPGGFPPADDNVREWFLRGTTKREAFTRAGAFFCAPFVTLHRYLQHIDDEIANISNNEPVEPDSLEAKFRLLMTEGQTFDRQGQPRTNFYEDVLELANKILPQSSPSTSSRPMLPSLELSLNTVKDVKYDLTEAMKNLMKYLIPDFQVNNRYPPALIISFDEAHSLGTHINDYADGLWSRLTELKRVLWLIHNKPCFVVVFLSTTGKVAQSMPGAISTFHSTSPFCELGFDQLAKKAVRGKTTLDEVSSTDFMTRLGRPLFASRYLGGSRDIQSSIIQFAGQKLLCKSFSTDERFVRTLTDMERLAIITVRIPLEFNTNPNSADREEILVERHMRMCLSGDPGLEAAVTVAPSEPILAEASSYVMQSPAFNLPISLLAEVKYPGLPNENRGELVVMTLCLQARDGAVTRLRQRIIPVEEFIQELIAPAHHDEVLLSSPVMARTLEEADKTLKDTFCKSHIYFNHFVKLHGLGTVTQEYLCGLMVRGAAVICADQQRGVDVLIPFLYEDKVLRPENVSAIFIQSKIDASYEEPHMRLFDMMNPNQIHFFVKKLEPTPIIRMVFALASSTPCVSVSKRAPRTQPLRKSALKAKFQADNYTAFDVWCGGASHETFRPIKKSEEAVFRKLLLRSRTCSDVYEKKRTKDIENATRSMNPGTDKNQAHWEQFCS